MTDEPARMSQQPDALGQLLQNAKGDVLPDAAVSRVHDGLIGAGIVGAGPGGSTPIPGWLGKVKVALIKARLVVLTLGVVGGAYWWSSSDKAEERGVPARPVPDEKQRIAVESQSATKKAAHAPVSPQEQAAEVPGAIVGTATRPRVETRTVATAAIASTAVPAALPTPREGALLLEARRALDSNPGLAGSLVKQHEREFPASQLAPERSRIAAEAARRGAP